MGRLRGRDGSQEECQKWNEYAATDESSTHRRIISRIAFELRSKDSRGRLSSHKACERLVLNDYSETLCSRFGRGGRGRRSGGRGFRNLKSFYLCSLEIAASRSLPDDPKLSPWRRSEKRLSYIVNPSVRM